MFSVERSLVLEFRAGVISDLNTGIQSLGKELNSENTNKFCDQAVANRVEERLEMLMFRLAERCSTLWCAFVYAVSIHLVHQQLP